jgi:hypothetical protein
MLVMSVSLRWNDAACVLYEAAADVESLKRKAKMPAYFPLGVPDPNWAQSELFAA